MRDPVGPRADFLFRRPTSLSRKGKLAPGKIQRTYAELYFLDHVQAEEKYLVLTDPEFYEKFRQDSRGKLPPGIGLLYCELPEDLKREVEKIRTTSRSELRPKNP